MLEPSRIGALAAEALRVEAWLTPKPGLVDAENSGAHHDMDLDLLLRSADALEPALIACAYAGRCGAEPEELLAIGRAGERAMFAATRGVNTHKGALFSLGLLAYCAAEEFVREDYSLDPVPSRRSAGYHVPEETNPDIIRAHMISHICQGAAKVASPWRDAWVSRMLVAKPETNGEQAHFRHGFLGARGEAASGFATARSAGLWTLWRAQDAGYPDALTRAFLALAAVNQDTNLVTRGGTEALEAVRSWCASALELNPESLTLALRRADAEWTARRWSPGGSADLLAVTWFLDELSRAALSGSSSAQSTSSAVA